MQTNKIILDTDIGDDIDDALALALALRSPELELLGVTTVFKNVRARAQLARRLLDLGGRPDIPVFAGCPQPLINRVDDREVPCQWSADMENARCEEEESAAGFLVRQAAAFPGEVTLVPIGPLTNIAAAIAACPDFKSRIKRIVLMGGAFHSHFAEWNIYCDPEAARIVFESGIPVVAVGLDVTLKCRLSRDEVDELKAMTGVAGDPYRNFLMELVDRWLRFSGNLPVLHDPLAVCAVFDEAVLTLKREVVQVETRGEFTRGLTFNRTGGDWVNPGESEEGAWIAEEVDAPRFFATFLPRVFGASFAGGR
ncbi:nucleoside hydrolase [Cohnella rhizosphaerae]|uniref:Nucleoside hydrolase n=1 Tax=Cohnella rhizosphaerae TaxID=1457232 RepID=A0A9X4QUB0_9BACL|nr:nucleoside hydrolase [Cohnella rhizosphaerae]MDG0811289.1 nucleoside hydrolase [Cohnella rhizosphaerae]